MPTYEYRCRTCGEHVEVVQSFKDDKLTECGLCGGDLRKVFSATGIIFKGSGYYVTDTRKAAASNGAGEDSKDTSKDTSSDTKKDGSGTDGSGTDGSGKDTNTKKDSSPKKDTGSSGAAAKSA